MARVGDIVSAASQAVAELTGFPVSGVSAVDRTDDGWQVDVDVVELVRVPDTTSVLATYEVQVGEDGDVHGYRRTRRFLRSATEET